MACAIDVCLPLEPSGKAVAKESHKVLLLCSDIHLGNSNRAFYRSVEVRRLLHIFMLDFLRVAEVIHSKHCCLCSPQSPPPCRHHRNNMHTISN